MKKYIILMLLLAGCQNEEKPAEQPTEEPKPSSQQTEGRIASDLNIPWQIAKNGDELIVTEREGTIQSIKNQQKTALKLSLNKPIVATGESGLLGFVLHPDDADKAFLYYTYEDNGLKNRVVTVTRDGNAWSEDAALLDDITGGVTHNGGRLELSPDNQLFITVGDGGNADLAQDKEALAGKILKMNLDGSVPDDNPFDNYIYSYGHRNPQGIVFKDDKIYAVEHGNSNHDEINEIQKGHNYGWPVIEGDEQQDGMETPIYETGDSTLAPSGIDIKGDVLYIAALKGESIQRYDIESGELTPLVTDQGRIRDVFIDGDVLYYITNNTDGRGNPDSTDDQLIKITLK